MSKLMNARTRTMEYRRRFLSTTSVAALLYLAMVSGEAQAGNSDKPDIWIDLGWHFEHVGGQGDAYAPPFLQVSPRPDFETVSPLDLEKTLAYSYGAEGMFSYQPEDTNWVFTGAVRFGRARSHKMLHQQTDGQYPNPKYAFQHNRHPSQTFPRSLDRPQHQFADTDASNSENHTVIDFQAGKDVGLGMFGRGGSSSFGVGVRFAQFNSKSDARIRENPDLYFNPDLDFSISTHHHSYYASLHSTRSFRGVGPSISWNASAAITGNEQDGELRVDWGLNAALLFGRQKVKTHHATNGVYVYRPNVLFSNGTRIYYTNNPPDHVRSRSVMAPNAGGFAGLSYRVENFQMSLGYRADYFVGAVDGGWDTRHNVTRSFNGPFASISFGVSPSDF